MTCLDVLQNWNLDKNMGAQMSDALLIYLNKVLLQIIANNS